MAMSRLQKLRLAGKLTKKTLTLDEKIKFIYKIEKTATANILKSEKKTREQNKCFVKNQGIVTVMASTTK